MSNNTSSRCFEISGFSFRPKRFVSFSGSVGTFILPNKGTISKRRLSICKIGLFSKALITAGTSSTCFSIGNLGNPDLI